VFRQLTIPMDFPEVKLKLVLEIDGCEELIAYEDFTDVVGDLMSSGDLTPEKIKAYVLEVRSKL
jgi:hypothetical protein